MGEITIQLRAKDNESLVNKPTLGSFKESQLKY